MITKKRLIQVINGIPEKTDNEELVFLCKIEQEIYDAESGKKLADSLITENMEKRPK